MSSYSTKMICTIKQMELSEIISCLQEMNAETVYVSVRQLGEYTSAAMLAMEKLYLRNSSYASLAVMLTEKDGIQRADIVGYGGGSGMLNISLGANSEFADKAAGILEECGFEEEEEESWM